MNICSLLPAATEIICRLRLEDQITGVTHECDFPPGVRLKTILTCCAFDSENMKQAEIDDAAFQNHQIFLVDANSYFSRPGPRLVDGLEILAEMLHAEYFAGMAPYNSYTRTV